MNSLVTPSELLSLPAIYWQFIKMGSCLSFPRLSLNFQIVINIIIYNQKYSLNILLSQQGTNWQIIGWINTGVSHYYMPCEIRKIWEGLTNFKFKILTFYWSSIIQLCIRWIGDSNFSNCSNYSRCNVFISMFIWFLTNHTFSELQIVASFASTLSETKWGTI